MKTKTSKNGPVPRLYEAALEIVQGTRGVFERSGKDAREIRVPILIHGTDMRITIEAGPKIAARNAIEHAQMEASGKPAAPMVEMSKTVTNAQSLMHRAAQQIADICTDNRGEWLPQFADERTLHDQLRTTAEQLVEVERLL